MTNQLEDTKFIPRSYDIFGGLDVDKKSIAVTFTDHGTMRKSLRLPYSASQLLINKLADGLRGGQLRSISCAGSQLSRTASSGAIARYAGGPIAGHQMSDQVAAAV